MSSGLHIRFDDPVAFRTEYERNIIQGGAFVPTTRRFDLRSTETVELELAWCGEVVSLEAEIVHCTPTGTDPGQAGVAVQFLSPIEELRERLGPIATAAAAAAEAAAPPPAVETESAAELDTLDLEPEAAARDLSRSDFALDEPDAVELTAPAPEEEVAIELGATAADAEPAIGETTDDELALDLEATGSDALSVELGEAGGVEPLQETTGSGPVLDLEVESDPLAPAASGAVEIPGAFDPLAGLEERRSAERLAARLPVHVDAAHISLDGRTRDISENGVLLSADGSDLPVGKKVTLALTHPQTGERLTIDGTVARHIESSGTVGAVGIAFDRSLDGDEHLRSFIREVQAAEKARRDAGISGVIEELGMANLLQMFGQSSPCGTLTVSSGSEEGVVAFQQGDLRYVRLGNLRGVKALARLLGWEHGAFEFVSHVDPLPEEDAPLPLEGALLEAMRQVDEAAREEGGEIDPGAILRLDRTALTSLDKPLAQIEEAVLDLAAAGLSVRRLLDVIPEPDGDILSALRALRDRGLVELELPDG